MEEEEEARGIVLVCAACGVKKQTDWPDPRWAMELAAWAIEEKWHALWGNNRGGMFVRLFCSDRCKDANITRKGTLKVRATKLEPVETREDRARIADVTLDRVA